MPPSPSDLLDGGIEHLLPAMALGLTSSEAVVRACLDRIARLDKHGPCINALISLDPDASAAALRSDERRRAGAPIGLLEGIPFVVKDNFDTLVLSTTGGSAVLAGNQARANASAVQKLLDQGAILIGKANMSELSASCERLGYSSAGGLTLNPYNTRRSASGSSSGSAAAVAAGFAAFALGTDTSGSIRGPASVTGLVGLRPTLGLVSRAGVIPLSLSADTAGAITRTVEDMALVLDVIAGPDPSDAATLMRPPSAGSYRTMLDGFGPKGRRLGVLTNFRGGDPEVDSVEQEALRRLKSLGATVRPVTLPRRFEELWGTVLKPLDEAEFKPQFERYLRTVDAGGVRSLADLIERSEAPAVAESATPVNPARLQGLRQANETALTASPSHIAILSQIIPTLRQDLTALMDCDDLDALVFPTLSCTATPRFDRPDPAYTCRCDDPYKAGYIAAALGFPEISVPAAIVSGDMPVDYSFLGRPDQEARLLGLARAFLAGAPRIARPAPP